MTTAKSIVLFVLAAAAEIGGAWLVWQSVREGKDHEAQARTGTWAVVHTAHSF